MIVSHVLVTVPLDYVTRREPHRAAHLERLESLRAAGAVIGGGPAPDGGSVDLFYRLPEASQLKVIVEEDPYFTGGAWASYTSRTFITFVDPWQPPPVVTDGSRRVTIVEGPVGNPEMVQFALIEMRGAGRIAFGGLFADGQSLAIARTPDEAEARGWFADTGFWPPDRLTTRGWLYVL
jgi:uncharacterized protein YciI